MKRITFSEYDAEHIYELLIEHLVVGDKGNCYTCGQIDKRLQKFLGKKSVNWVIRIVKKRGYCNKLVVK